MVANRDQAGQAGRLNDGAGNTNCSVTVQVLMETGLTGLCHRSTRRKVSREMIMFAICICPHLPHSDFDRAAPPGVRFQVSDRQCGFCELITIPEAVANLCL